jgi:hypothetical protein
MYFYGKLKTNVENAISNIYGDTPRRVARNTAKQVDYKNQQRGGKFQRLL